jgi:2-keto-3-deoxy-L-rhamnonate aldolase RhmA
MAVDDADEVAADDAVVEVNGTGLGCRGQGRRATVASEGAGEDLADSTAFDKLLQLADGRVLVALQTDDHLALRQLDNLLRVLGVGCNGPFDVDVLAGGQGGLDRFVVAVNADAADDEVDVCILGELFWSS